jgi:hypothetical protein
MRPILVLLLVVIAIAALIFGVYSLLGDTPDTGTSVDRVVEAPIEPVTPDTSNLAGNSGAVRTEPQRVVESDRANVRSSADYGNLLRGTVNTPEGQPLEGAEITLTGHATDTIVFVNDPVDRSKDMVARTDKDGTYVFQDVPPRDRYKLIARHPDYAETSMMSNRIDELGEFVEPPMHMKYGAQLSGYVSDTAGNSVPDAVLHLDGMFVLEDGETAERRTIRTDAEGFYTFMNVPQGNEHRTLLVESTGYASQQRQGLIFRPDQDTMTIDFTLQPALMLAGRVIGPGNEGLPRVKVVAVGTQHTQRGARSVSRTNERGEFLFEDLAPGQYMLQARKNGYRYRSVPRVEAGEANVIIEMLEEGKVTGRIVDASTSEPVQSFTARLRFYYEENVPTAPSEIEDSFTHENGEYMLTGVKAGKYVVEGRADGYSPSFSLPFSVTQSQDIAGIEVRMTKGGLLTGRIVDGRGDPVPGARVRTEDNEYIDDLFQRALGNAFPTNATTRETRTDKDGRFQLIHLHPANYQIIVNAVGYTEKSVQAIDVVEGGEHDLGSLALISGGTLKGTIYDSSGNPVVSGMVQLEPTFVEEGLPYRRYETKSGADGKFRLANISPGTYRMTASSSADNTANPFEQMLEAKNSEISVTIGDAEEVTQNLTIRE